MSKWYCEECGSTFDESDIETKTTWSHSNYIGFGGDYPETESYCPYCHSDAIAECERCEFCDEEVAETYSVAGIDMCEECRDKVNATMKKVLDTVVGDLDIDAVDAQILIGNYFEEN